MSVTNSVPLPAIGSEIKTACNETEKFAANTPRALHEGKWIFFCLPVCQKEFLEDPSSSCYASQIENEVEQ
jgi:YHS domain-containing protein